MAVAVTTKIVTAENDVYSVTTTPQSGETQAQVNARHAADVRILAAFVESQMGKHVTMFVNEPQGFEIEREDEGEESLESMSQRLLEALQP